MKEDYNHYHIILGQLRRKSIYLIDVLKLFLPLIWITLTDPYVSIVIEVRLSITFYTGLQVYQPGKCWSASGCVGMCWGALGWVCVFYSILNNSLTFSVGIEQLL